MIKKCKECGQMHTITSKRLYENFKCVSCDKNYVSRARTIEDIFIFPKNFDFDKQRYFLR